MTFEAIFFTVIWTCSSFINTITGLGAGAIATPICSLVLPPKQVIVIGTLAAVFLTIGTLFIYRRYIDWKVSFFFWGCSIPGSICGVWLLKIISVHYLQILLSISIIVQHFVQHFAHSFVSNLTPHKFYTIFLGFLSGFFASGVGVNAPVMIIYALLMKMDKDRSRAFFATSAISVIVSCILYAFDGLISQSDCLYAGITIPFVFLSIYLARPIACRLNHKTFNFLITLLLIFAVINLLYRSIPELSA